MGASKKKSIERNAHYGVLACEVSGGIMISPLMNLAGSLQF